MSVHWHRQRVAAGKHQFIVFACAQTNCFSGDFEPSEVIRYVRLELKKMGFLLNEQKTRIQRPGRQQTVTGIVVNEKLSIPADYRRKLRQELYYCRKFILMIETCWMPGSGC